MKKLFVLLLIIVAMFIFMIGCSENNDNNLDKQFYSTDENVFLIETPYCDLQYPEKWHDVIVLNKEEYSDGYKVEFYAKVQNEKIHIFDIAFAIEEGDFLGVLNKDGQDISVSMINYNLDLDRYPEEQRLNIGCMCEDVNIVISKLIEQYDFKAVI